MCSKGFRFKFGIVALALQTAFAIVFAFRVEYDESADPKSPLMASNETKAVLASKYPRK